MPENDVNQIRRIILATLPLLALPPRADAQDASKVQPQSYHIALENSHVRVFEFNSRPGMGVCGTGMHSHPGHVTVLLTTGNVRVKTLDGKVQEIHDMPAGTVFWEEPVTHTVENISGSEMRSLIIEIKPAQA